jgi:hypothetical protein
VIDAISTFIVPRPPVTPNAADKIAFPDHLLSTLIRTASGSGAPNLPAQKEGRPQGRPLFN